MIVISVLQMFWENPVLSPPDLAHSVLLTAPLLQIRYFRISPLNS
jgi:hypothetical protein